MRLNISSLGNNLNLKPLSRRAYDSVIFSAGPLMSAYILSIIAVFRLVFFQTEHGFTVINNGLRKILNFIPVPITFFYLYFLTARISYQCDISGIIEKGIGHFKRPFCADNFREDSLIRIKAAVERSNYSRTYLRMAESIISMTGLFYTVCCGTDSGSSFVIIPIKLTG